MTFRLALAAGVLALAACQSSTPPASDAATQATPAPANGQPAVDVGCAANTERLWGLIGPSDHPSNRIRAWVSGTTCETAVITLAIYARDGFPIYAWAGATQHLFFLKDATDAAGMQTALEEWIGPANLPDMTGGLPPWDETDGQPKRAEFPFMPNMEKAAYEELRAANRHMFCFPQGSESQLCLALHEGPMVEEIGVQLFPG